MSIEQTLVKKVIGAGPNLVLLHGWGVNSRIWQPVQEQLAQHFCLHLIDLPGFGENSHITAESIQEIAALINDVLPEQASLLGWSLGGLIATEVSCLYPEKITQLIQVCASPKFVADATCPGVEASVFDNFQMGLQKNTVKTLSRFIGIQAMGCSTTKQDVQLIKSLLKETTVAEISCLSLGLDLLKEQDLRLKMQQLSMPCLSVFAEFDSLVPQSAAVQVQSLLPAAQVVIIKDSAHAPFVSKPSEFCETVINFIGA